MSNFTSMLKRCIIALTLVVCGMYGHAQVSPTVSVNGFSLQKSVSLSSAKSGDIFTYTVTFSIPAGAIDVFVYDQIPSPLVIDGVITPASYSGFVPTVTNVGGLVKLYFPSVTSSISGSFQVNVHFPVDSACNGKRVPNFAELTAKLPPETRLKTEPVYTTCVVDNPWRIWKSPVGLAYVGGSCPYGTLSDTVEYLVQIAKQNWVLSGSASGYNVNVNDVLSPGATVLTTTYSSSANMSGSSITTMGVITLPAGFKLDANANNVYWARFKIKHAPIALGNCDSNTVKLAYTDACNNQFSDVSSIKIRKIPPPVPAPNVALAKWVSVSGNVPGCTGTYYIRVCNTGTAASAPYTLADNFPVCLTVTGSSAPSGCTISGPLPPSNYTMSGPSLLPGQCHLYSFNFTIGSGCVGSVTNTVTATSGFTGSYSSTFYLLPPAPTACLTKAICGPTPNAYAVGSLVRFRLRVQNIGGTPITGTDIQDQLDNGSLEYVGNELYYSFPNPFAPCGTTTTPPSGSTPWSPVTTSHNTSTGALKWNLPAIPVECGNVAYPACGFAYGLRAYYIEFTVKIKDTAGLGNIKNCAVIGNGNLTSSVNSCATFVTNGVLNYTLNKTVSKDNGATYSSSVTVSPGAVVDYKLSGINSGIGLINPVLVDLLPRDNGTSDNYILSCLSRGSNFDVRYNSFVSSTHTYSGQFFSSVAGASTVSDFGISLGCMPNAPGWVTSPSVGAANLRTQFTQPFGSSLFAYIFKAKTDPNAKEGDVACNSYALRGLAKYLINYAPSYVPQTPLESGKACITLEKSSGCCDPYDFDIPREVCYNINAQYCVKDTCNPANDYYWDFGDGSPVVVGTCINYAYTHPGTYTITIKWRNECGDYYKQFEVNVKECPCDVKVAFTINTNDLTIVADGTATTSSLPAVVYVWSFGDGTYGTGPIANHTYANPGGYVVQLLVYALDSKGNICDCKGECRTDIYVDKGKIETFYCNKDKKMKPEDVALKAAPNPFRDKVTVSFELINKTKISDQSGYTLEFMNTNGVVLQRMKLQNLQSPVALDSRTYSAGVYFVVLKNSKGDVQTMRVVKL